MVYVRSGNFSGPAISVRIIDRDERSSWYIQQEYFKTCFSTCSLMISHSETKNRSESVSIGERQTQPTWIGHKVTEITDIRFLRQINSSTVIGPWSKFQRTILFIYQRAKKALVRVHHEEVHCLPKGKNRTSIAHELRKMPVDNHVTVPSEETITFVDIWLNEARLSAF